MCLISLFDIDSFESLISTLANLIHDLLSIFYYQNRQQNFYHPPLKTQQGSFFQVFNPQKGIEQQHTEKEINPQNYGNKHKFYYSHTKVVYIHNSIMLRKRISLAFPTIIISFWPFFCYFFLQLNCVGDLEKTRKREKRTREEKPSSNSLIKFLFISDLFHQNLILLANILCHTVFCS